MRTALLSLVTASLLPLAACGDDRVDADRTGSDGDGAAPTVAIRVTTVGGCEVRGPNCPTYVVWSDGRVEIMRTGEPAVAEVTGTIPAADVAAVVQQAAAIDVAALTERVGPGECQACVDGVDLEVTITLPSGEVVLDSTELAFDPTEPLFAELDDLLALARGVGELPLVER